LVVAFPKNTSLAYDSYCDRRCSHLSHNNFSRSPFWRIRLGFIAMLLTFQNRCLSSYSGLNMNSGMTCDLHSDRCSRHKAHFAAAGSKGGGSRSVSSCKVVSETTSKVSYVELFAFLHSN